MEAGGEEGEGLEAWSGEEDVSAGLRGGVWEKCVLVFGLHRAPGVGDEAFGDARAGCGLDHVELRGRVHEGVCSRDEHSDVVRFE